MSNLENKLNASIQSPRRRTPATGTPAQGEKSPVTPKTAPKLDSKVLDEVVDLNAGGGRETNPQRIWPD